MDELEQFTEVRLLISKEKQYTFQVTVHLPFPSQIQS